MLFYDHFCKIDHFKVMIKGSGNNKMIYLTKRVRKLQKSFKSWLQESILCNFICKLDRFKQTKKFFSYNNLAYKERLSKFTLDLFHKIGHGPYGVTPTLG